MECEVGWMGLIMETTDYLWNLVFFAEGENRLAGQVKNRRRDASPVRYNRPRSPRPPNPRSDHPIAPAWKCPNLLSYALVPITQCGLAVLIAVAVGLELQSDFHKKMDQHAKELQIRVETCAKAYAENRCSPDTRVPVAAEFCEEMERCLALDSVYSVQTVARLVGETLESFVSAMSLRTLLSLAGLIALYTSRRLAALLWRAQPRSEVAPHSKFK